VWRARRIQTVIEGALRETDCSERSARMQPGCDEAGILKSGERVEAKPSVALEK
jgi:hypothetical protein